MPEYEWSRKTPMQQACGHVLTGIGVLIVGYVMLAVSTGHLMTAADLNWNVAWGILRCILIIALFPVILLPLMLAFEAKYPPEFQHLFYCEWAYLRTRRASKGGGGSFRFSVKDVDSVRLQRSFFKDKPIFLLTIQLKASVGNRPSLEKVAICAENEAELRPLEDWLRTNQIMVTWDLPLEIQRRS